MLRERVANNIYVFSSELYAQVTASVIVTPAGAIVIDTLPFPVETQTIVRFVEERHGIPVRYVINTHYHADHTYGTCFFKQARVVSHRLCRNFLNERGRAGLERDQQNSREMATISLRLPDIIFDKGEMFLHLGGTTLKMWHAPGHSPDNILCLVEEDQILFAADVLMPIPFFSDGNWPDYVATLESLRGQSFESVVQGHGEVILRGEVQSKIEDDLAYLHTIRNKVERVITQGLGREALAKIDIESCGKSRIPLNGLVQQLHHSNLETLYSELVSEAEQA
jgi:glyoxylase-like metal-dependent hydrolase (beta-lactamase superfamily II)